ncbi:hypothetical protein [Amycolatopsis sp. TNS106]|nr:hypothetical protein [Amycolatopsis sp. TNS106]QXV57454.1 hypothetical protein CVV72_10925 [Amycolatopsis sp. TNS106]
MTGSGKRERVVLRVYAGDGRRHAYLAIDLAQEGYFQVHPVCNLVFGYRLAHLAELIGSVSFRDLGNRFEVCDACLQWLRDQPHEVLVDNEIVAMHGTLDLSALPFSERDRLTSGLGVIAAA